MPELICFRYNPGPRRVGNDIIGNPIEAKYGVSHEQIVEAYRRARDRGARRFGLHTMLASNELNHRYMVQTARMLLDLVEEISRELAIIFEFINIGGGLGIPYCRTARNCRSRPWAGKSPPSSLASRNAMATPLPSSWRAAAI